MTEAVLSTTTECEAAWLLRRSGDDDFIVRLAGDKVTIGSGQSCSVRLTEPGVRPLHCLITPTADGLVVRRWSDGTLLNGETFAEAPFEPGDTLTIGPVDLLLDTPSTAEADAPTEYEEDHRTTADNAGHADEPPSDGPLWTVDSTVEALTEATAAVAEDANQIAPLKESVRNNRGRARQLARLARRQRGENARLSAEVAALKARLADAQNELGQLVDERDELRTQLGALARDMIQVREELNARSVADNQKVVELERRLADLQQQIVERDALVDDLREELARRREASEHDQPATHEPQAPVAPEAALAEALKPTEFHAPSPGTEADEVAPATPELPQEVAPAAPAGEYPTQKFADWGASSDDLEDAEQASPVEHLSAEPADDEGPAPAELLLEHKLLSADPWDVAEPSTPTTVDGDLINAAPAPGEGLSSEDPWDVECQAPEPPAVPAAELTVAELEPPTLTSEPFAAVGVAETPPEQLATLEEEGLASDEVLNTSAADEAEFSTPTGELELPVTETIEDEPTPETEGDVWGRLSSLRAAASEKLHYEVEHPGDTAPEVDPLLSMPLSEVPAVESEADDEQLHSEPTEVAADVEAESIVPTTAFDAPPEQPKEREEPVSFVEKFKHLLDGDADAEATPAIETLAVEPPAPAPIAETPAAGDGEDESIEEYMSKMMARLRGESSPEPAAAEKPAKASAVAAQPAEPAKPAPAPETSEPPAARPNPLADMLASGAMMPTPPERPLENLDEIKTSAKPEEGTDMSTLRDLANSSAREAIKIANTRRYREVVLTNLLMCITGAIGGAYLVWSAGGQLGIQLFCGAGAIAGAAFWALRTARSVSEPPPPEPKQADASDSSHALPIAGVDKD